MAPGTRSSLPRMTSSRRLGAAASKGFRTCAAARSGTGRRALSVDRISASEWRLTNEILPAPDIRSRSHGAYRACVARPDQRIEPLLDNINNQYTDPSHPGGPEFLTKITRLRFDIHEDMRRKILYVLRTLFAPRPPHIRMLALPPGTQFLYNFVRVIHDYLLLPCRKLWKAIR